MHRTAAPHVVVIGGGFGGLTAARGLAAAAEERPLRVTLVDRRNHHTFQPLLYQVATSGLQPQDVGHPLRPIFGLRRLSRRGTAVDVRLGEVIGVDRERRVVHLDDGDELAYDRLVVAAGARTSDFGVPGVAEHGFGLKSINEALALRDHVLRRFEHAANHPGSIADGELTFVVAGAGPTGVELAGALAELVDDVLSRDHPHLDHAGRLPPGPRGGGEDPRRASPGHHVVAGQDVPVGDQGPASVLPRAPDSHPKRGAGRVGDPPGALLDHPFSLAPDPKGSPGPV